MKKWTNKEIKFISKNYHAHPIDILNKIFRSESSDVLYNKIKITHKRYLDSKKELLG